jgi:ABC-type branched-subunit amino acid transport system ATPase component/ABC-type branched-subunit amino acid transport system permease subunit
MKFFSHQRLFLITASVIALCLIIAPLVVQNNFQLRVVMLFMIYALVAMGLNILVGLVSLVSLGQAGIYALGAYTVGVLTVQHGWPLFATMGAAIVLSAVVGVVLAYPTVRVRGVYLAVVTIAFGLIVQNVVIDWRTVTGGTLGISNIPRADLGFGPLDTTGLYTLIAGIMFVAFLLHHNLIYSRYGRAMHAVAQSETAASSLGINPANQRVFAFVISAVYAGIAGALYAYLNRYVNPDTFSFSDSIRFLLMVILGGSGTTLGPLLGAGILTWIPNLLQAFGKWQLFVYGALLAAVIFLLPKGIIGTLNSWLRSLMSRSRNQQQSAEPWPKASDQIAGFLRSHDQIRGPIMATSELTIKFGGLTALSNVSLQVERASVHAIIGPNGAGKTTMLNALSGFYKPTSGVVYLNQQDIGSLTSDQVARIGLTRTFQNTELFSEMTVKENIVVAFNSRYKTGILGTLLRLPGYFREENKIDIQSVQLLDYVGLRDFAGELAKNLAFGHQRRLEIARALGLSPQILLLDEPAAGLTHAEIDELIALIRDLKSLGVTIILVEHHVDMIMAVSDHVTVLDYGEVIASGTPAQVRDDPRVIEAYFGAVVPTEFSMESK